MSISGLAQNKMRHVEMFNSIHIYRPIICLYFGNIQIFPKLTTHVST